MSPLVEDLRFSLRVMRRSPGLTFVAVLTLSLGIAANTTVFGWVDSLLLEPVRGISDSSGLYVLETSVSGAPLTANTSFRDFQDFRDHLPSVADIAVAKNAIISVGPDGDAQRVWAEVVSSNYFRVLGLKPVLGRTFDPDRRFDAPGSQPEVVISDRMWRTRFNADPNILGRTLRVNRHELRIVAVTPREFAGSLSALVYDLWIPFAMQPQLGIGGSLTGRATRDCTATFLRLKPGARLPDAQGELTVLASLLDKEQPLTNKSVRFVLLPLLSGHGGAQGLLRGTLTILLIAGMLLLLIVCGNVANLLLAHAVGRQREFAVRLAMGAARGDLSRLALAHSFLLTLFGSAGGVLVAVWMSAGLQLLLPPGDTPIALRSVLNPTTLAFTVVLCVLVAVAAGIGPALFCSATNLRDSLNDSGRGGGSGLRAGKLRGLLVMAEVALATVALTGAGLSLQSFRNATRIRPGFEARNVTVAQYFLSGLGYKAADEVRFMRELRDRLLAVPGITAAAYSEQLPLDFGLLPLHQMEPAGYVAAPGETLYIHRMFVSPGWFHLMKIPLLEGRDFRATDQRNTERVLIVNQTFADRYMGGRNPVGRKVRVDRAECTVVGMVRDTKYHRMNEPATPFAYLPFDQAFSTGLTPRMYVRSAPGAFDDAPAALRREARLIDPSAGAFNLAPLSVHIQAAVYAQRVAATLLAVLGGGCLLLAGIGLYGVMSYSAGQRRHEIGVRLALGARPAQISFMVLRDAVAVSLPGAVAGMILAVALAPKLDGLLVDVSASDLSTLVAVWAFLTATAMIASYLPARRASATQPIDWIRTS